MKTAVASQKSPRRAFTLIEVMIVVAIVGLIAAMGVPSIFQALRKDGMRKAISDVKDALDTALEMVPAEKIIVAGRQS